MSTILVNDTTMIDIADAIRAKDGSTDQMYPSEMAERIGAISMGGGEENNTYSVICGYLKS